MNSPMTSFVRERLQKAGRGAWSDIAKATGVAESTIQKIAYGIPRDYRIGSIEPLYLHFASRQYLDLAAKLRGKKALAAA